MTANAFIDGHLHAWDRRKWRYPWLDGDLAAPVSFEPSDLPARHGAIGAVFIEAGAHPADALLEAKWAASLSEAVCAVVASAPVELGHRVQVHLEQLTSVPLVVGVRKVLQDEPAERLLDKRLTDGLRQVGARGFTFDLCVRAQQLPQLVALIRRVPDTMFVLDHLGKPPLQAGWEDPRARRWNHSLRDLAAEPNVVVKLSGLAAEAAGGPVEPQARPFVEAALEAFGPDRALIGSDWPVSQRTSDEPGAYQRWFDFILNDFGLASEEQRLLAYGTAARTYRLVLDESYR